MQNLEENYDTAINEAIGQELNEAGSTTDIENDGVTLYTQNMMGITL